MTIRDIVKTVLPPRACDACKRLLGLPVYEPVQEGQKGPEFYDRTFDEDEYWKRHYTEVQDYACWAVIIDRLRAMQARRLLEIGCGSGQLAAAIRDAGMLESYCGFDFSARRLAQAQATSPALRFEVANASKTDLYETFDYDSALSTEFLEHVEGDLVVLSKLKPGTKFVGIVPNFPTASKVGWRDGETAPPGP